MLEFIASGSIMVAKEEHDNVREIQNKTNKLIKQTKEAYYTQLGDQHSDPKTGPKIFCFLPVS